MKLIPPSYWRNTSTYEHTSALDAPEDDLLTVLYTKEIFWAALLEGRAPSASALLVCPSADFLQPFIGQK